MIQRTNILVLSEHNMSEFSRISGIPTEVLERKYHDALVKGENCVFEIRIKQRHCRTIVTGGAEPNE